MKIAVATPVRALYPGAAQVSYGYSESLRMLSHEMGLDIIDPTIAYGLDVMRARNRIAAKVLREMPDVTHILWWDDDQWPADRRVVAEMVESGADVVSVPYTAKEYPLHPVHMPIAGEIAGADGLIERKWLGFGFTITTTRALQWMTDECSRRMTYDWRVYTDGKQRHRVASLFGPMYRPTDEWIWKCAEDDTLISEDFAFCERWRELGGKVHEYTRAGIVFHAGPHAFAAVGVAR